jgi:uncharacterized protein (TIGR03382 family)
MNARFFFQLCAVGLLIGSSQAARAQARNGDILVPEYLTGSVVNIRGGGNFAGVPRFATGLSNPMSVCQGPGGHIYVTEFTAGQVTIITQGGDFTNAAPFAFNLSGAASLWCSPTQIIVSELNPTPAQITDITAGGNYAGVAPFARIQRNPASLLRDSNGRLWVSSFNDGIIDITAGGTFTSGPFFAANNLPASRSSIALAQMGSMLLVGNEHTDQIFDFTAGGNFTTLPVFALVDGVIGLRFIPQTGQLLASSELDDAIYDITAGGDFRDGDPPFATGLDPNDVSQLAYVSLGGCGDGAVDAGEECDDGDVDQTDECTNECRFAVCGDGFVRSGVEECDDGNSDDTDACRSNCEEAFCGDGFVQAGVEACDDGNTVDGDGCSAVCVIEPAPCGDAGHGPDAGPAVDAGLLADERSSSGDGAGGCSAAPGASGLGAGFTVAFGLLAVALLRRRRHERRRA